MLEKQEKRIKRHKKIRVRIKETAKIPRICVYKSNKYIEVQIINDEKGKTLASSKAKLSEAKKAGKDIAAKAKEKKIEKAVFDRGGYQYHGRIKTLADTAREGGLKF